ncbi:MAG: thiamine pyrophosphate-binding protein [Epsilonproteobacteria bacterium]|nr:thiamine pyrophosphate-binding protein [Campylobacterota bacterium]
MKMRVTDYIANYIYDELNVAEVFMLTGGGAMFLNDGVAKHEKLDVICNHHEQACAMGAVAYSKYTNKIGVACVTTGCGGTNAVTGVLDAWQDSTQCLFISGQVKKKETCYNTNLPLRQFGVQEADIVAVVKSITKYSVMVNEPNEIAYHLEKATYLAKSGRPGPVWIDIPLDVQGAIIDTDNLKHFDIEELTKEYKENMNDADIDEIIELLNNAQRPMIIAGNGIRLSDTVKEFRQFINNINIPVTTSYLAIDLMPTSDEKFIGRLGTKGDRAGNFAVQNADVVLVLGSRLSVALTGFEYDLFMRDAKVIVVDIDLQEHKKNTVKIDKFVNANLKNFFEKINKKEIELDTKEWIEKCNHWKNKWPIALERYENEEKINKYTFMDHLCKFLKEDTAVVSDAGSSYYVTSQALRIRANQRYITSGAQADMGFTLPAAIGTCFAKKGEVVGITGDGSFQMNIQEIQTMKHYNLPLKLFVWNNNGYLSIRATQRKFFDGRAIGTDKDSGISFPEVEKIANAYGIQYFIAKEVSELDNVLNDVMNYNGPVICEIICPENQEIIPTTASMRKEDGTMVSKPLEDMYPFLDREEFYSEMINKPVAE